MTKDSLELSDLAKFGLMILTFVYLCDGTIFIKSWIQLFTLFYYTYFCFFDIIFLLFLFLFMTPPRYIGIYSARFAAFYFVPLFLCIIPPRFHFFFFLYISRWFHLFLLYFYVIIFHVTTPCNFVGEENKSFTRSTSTKFQSSQISGESVETHTAIVTVVP